MKPRKARDRGIPFHGQAGRLWALRLGAENDAYDAAHPGEAGGQAGAAELPPWVEIEIRCEYLRLLRGEEHVGLGQLVRALEQSRANVLERFGLDGKEAADGA